MSKKGAISTLRGHEIIFDEDAWEWVYKDTGLSTAKNYKKTACGHCGEHYTIEGHDPCIGTLPGLMNACCGHGEVEEAYVQFIDGFCIDGEDALIIQDILKKYRR